MNRQVRYGTSLLVFLIVGLSVYGYFFHVAAGPGPVSNPDFSVTAAGLTRSFDRSERASDSLYLHKALMVRGIVRQISQDADGAYTVTMSGDRPEGTAVECRLDSQFNSRYSGLRAGDSLSLAGVCAGRLGDVVLVQCIIEK